MIQRTFDYRKIKRLLSIPPIISSDIIYLIDNDIGVWSFNEYLDGLMVHQNVSIACRGKIAVNSGKKAIEWIFKNTDKKVIYAKINKEKRAACYMARWCGMLRVRNDNQFNYYEIKKCLN